MVHFVEKSDDSRRGECSHVPVSPLVSALLFPSRQMLLGWLLVPLVLHRMRRNIPALLLIFEGQATYALRATSGTGPAGVLSQGLPAPG